MRWQLPEALSGSCQKRAVPIYCHRLKEAKSRVKNVSQMFGCPDFGVLNMESSPYHLHNPELWWTILRRNCYDAPSSKTSQQGGFIAQSAVGLVCPVLKLLCANVKSSPTSFAWGRQWGQTVPGLLDYIHINIEYCMMLRSWGGSFSTHHHLMKSSDGVFDMHRRWHMLTCLWGIWGQARQMFEIRGIPQWSIGFFSKLSKLIFCLLACIVNNQKNRYPTIQPYPVL